eukprot:scaffold274522_cov14-Tisochrysis_lutea.AAC.2
MAHPTVRESVIKPCHLLIRFAAWGVGCSACTACPCVRSAPKLGVSRGVQNVLKEKEKETTSQKDETLIHIASDADACKGLCFCGCACGIRGYHAYTQKGSLIMVT